MNRYHIKLFFGFFILWAQYYVKNDVLQHIIIVILTIIYNNIVILNKIM